ncbi:hypothetical protein CT19431_MP80385 [Cupriavidus taiwanensis]|nr:hypothetical protein CT19431_MP80385 [Cupriavidus taiwanensis]
MQTCGGALYVTTVSSIRIVKNQRCGVIVPSDWFWFRITRKQMLHWLGPCPYTDNAEPGPARQ